MLVGGDQIQFQYQAGNGLLGVSVETSYKLNNDEWHSVHVERNRKVSGSATFLRKMSYSMKWPVIQ